MSLLKDTTRNSVILRLILIGVLSLLLLIPTGMISSIVYERETKSQEAASEVNSKWSNEQTVAGPILTVPYKKYVKDKDNPNKVVEITSYAHFLPERLGISGDIEPKMLKRGMYDVVVYNSKLDIAGSFKAPDWNKLNINPADAFWDQATVSINIPDMRGIKEKIAFDWNGAAVNLEPGVQGDIAKYLDLTVPVQYDNEAGMFGEVRPMMEPAPIIAPTGASGVSAKIPVGKDGNYNFKLALNLNGSQRLNFLPLGSETNVEIKSTWNNPSFDGTFLPDERNVTDSGFTAKWKVLQFNRNYPQSFAELSNANMVGSAFGVKLMVPVDQYQKTSRAVKYAILTIALTFLIFFFVEIFNKIRIHPFQYILIGLALVLFFTLLLSISEHLGFDWAYLISAASVLIMTSLYAKTVFKNIRATVIMFLILAAIYTFIYTILQLQDYALLIGSIGLFVILAVVMFISRKINWYEVASQ
ncbi:MAG: cell envelope integrity protein CreD [Candidatus Magasanikbacteria bacterium]|nr:cell envelope integrity protein CreD [Candidatus Magasanikbacteria bacterium]